MARRPPSERRAPPPLDAAALDRLALRYVERFATTRARLTDYLRRKVRERGFAGDAIDPAGIAERMAALGYIDDLAFGETRAAAMMRRGFGRRKVGEALRRAGLSADDTGALAAGIEDRALDAAITFARRKRIGPFADAPADRAGREKQIAAMIRGGHDFALARRIAAMPPGADVDTLVAG